MSAPVAPATSPKRVVDEKARARAVWQKKGNGWLNVPMWLTYVFLYVPMVVLIFMSFNASSSPFNFTGFSLKWYQELWNNAGIQTGLKNTLIVGAGTTVLSVILGTLLAVGLARYTRSAILNAFSLAPAIIPDIVLAIGLLSFYTMINMTLGLHSILLAHVVFATAFVTAIVQARLASLDSSLEEASRDLGANQFATFFRITLPSLMPAIIASALIAFTLSFDEFVIAFFTAGPTDPTLPIVIYSTVRFGVTPDVNALAAVLILISFTVVFAAQRITGLGGRKKEEDD